MSLLTGGVWGRLSPRQRRPTTRLSVKVRPPAKIDYSIIFTIHVGSVIHVDGVRLDWIG